jgi:hypothetical protein
MVNFTPSSSNLSENKDIAISRTLYFNGVTNSNWSTLTNWWQDSNYTIQASSLPIVIDNVIIHSSVLSIDSGSYPADRAGLVFNTYPTVNNLTFHSLTHRWIFFHPEIGVTDAAVFSSNAVNEWTIHGNTTFEISSKNQGVIFWDASFYDACNLGTVLGTSYEYGSSLIACSATSYQW